MPHFHVNLAPHLPGDGQRGGPGMVQPGTPELPRTELARVADLVATRLADR